jgi:hypothetical protein
MKKIFIILFVIIVGGGIVYTLATRDTPTPAEETAQDVFQQITFEVPDNFIALEQPHNNQVPNLNKIVVLMEKEDYQSVLNGEREGGEGPAAITIYEYENPEGFSDRAWTEKYAQLSNFQLITGPVTEKEIDGSGAISYNADGLYANRNVVLATGNLIYFISGGYLDQDSNLYRAFDKVVNSIEIKD